MVKKEASEILEVAKRMVGNMKDVIEVEEVIEKLEDYKQKREWISLLKFTYGRMKGGL